VKQFKKHITLFQKLYPILIMAVLASGFAYVHFDSICTNPDKAVKQYELTGIMCNFSEHQVLRHEECNSAMVCCFDANGDSNDKSAIEPVPQTKTIVVGSFPAPVYFSNSAGIETQFHPAQIISSIPTPF